LPIGEKMLETHREICFEASRILFATPCDHPYRKIRVKYADQIELQALVGNPKYNDFVVDLALKIIEASQCARFARC